MGLFWADRRISSHARGRRFETRRAHWVFCRKNPRTAYKDESKKHVAHHPGTPFSLCVSGAAKLLKS